METIIDAENILVVTRWEGGWGLGKKGEGNKKYKFAVTEQSWDAKYSTRYRVAE